MNRLRLMALAGVQAIAGAAHAGEAAKVVSTFPPTDAVVPAGIQQISVTYDRPMQDKSWSFSTGGEMKFPEVNGGPSISDDHRTFNLPVKLQPNTTYVVWMNSGRFQNFKDEQGQPATPYRLSFTTSE